MAWKRVHVVFDLWSHISAFFPQWSQFSFSLNTLGQMYLKMAFYFKVGSFLATYVEQNEDFTI